MIGIDDVLLAKIVASPVAASTSWRIDCFSDSQFLFVDVAQLNVHGLCDCLRHLALQRKYAAEIPLEIFRPDMSIGGSIDKPDNYANAVSLARNRALDNIAHAELFADRRHRQRSIQTHRRSS